MIDLPPRVSLSFRVKIWHTIDGTMDNAAATARYTDVAEACRVVRQAGWDQLPPEAFGPGSDLSQAVTVTLFEPQWRMVIEYLEKTLDFARGLGDETEIEAARDALDAITTGLGSTQ